MSKQCHYYEVHVKVPEWKNYAFQFQSEKFLKSRDDIIEQVVFKGLLYHRGHLPFICFAEEIEAEKFQPDEKMYFETTMSDKEYKYIFEHRPEYGQKMIHDRVNKQKPKKTYAKQNPIQ